MCRYRGKRPSTSFFLRREGTWPHGDVYRVRRGSSSSISIDPPEKSIVDVCRGGLREMLEGSKLNLLAKLHLLDSLLDQANSLSSHQANCHRFPSFFLFFSFSFYLAPYFFFLLLFLPVAFLSELNRTRGKDPSSLRHLGNAVGEFRLRALVTAVLISTRGRGNFYSCKLLEMEKRV